MNLLYGGAVGQLFWSKRRVQIRRSARQDPKNRRSTTGLALNLFATFNLLPFYFKLFYLNMLGQDKYT